MEIDVKVYTDKPKQKFRFTTSQIELINGQF